MHNIFNINKEKKHNNQYWHRLLYQTGAVRARTVNNINKTSWRGSEHWLITGGRLEKQGRNQ